MVDAVDSKSTLRKWVLVRVQSSVFFLELHMKRLLPLFLGAILTLQATPKEILQTPLPLLRKMLVERSRAIEAEDYQVHSVEDSTIPTKYGDVVVRTYNPSDEEDLPIAMLMHGGGWVFGSIDSHDNMARFLCQRSGVRVVSVGYALAPEAKFPRGLEECYEVLCHLAKGCDDISVIGVSAGGNFSAVLCLMARDRNGPKIKQQILIHPATDLRPSVNLGEIPDNVIHPQWYLSQYFDNLENVHHPYASPMAATDHSNLPPALVLLGERDKLFETGRLYAEKVGGRIYVQYGIGHIGSPGARAAPAALESLEVAAAALKNGVHGGLDL